MRPDLTPGLTGDTFDDHYWLLAELVAFCRVNGLVVSGPKTEVAARISTFLRTGERLRPKPAQRGTATMPTRFTRGTMIDDGWRCSQALRGFFRQELGHGFGFNKVMRDFIANGSGRTLQDAMDAWEADHRDPTVRSIDRQFEFNRFVRAVRATHPDACHATVVAAWKAHRDTPASQR